MPREFGFTLIELIIVIVILGILAVIAAPKLIDLSDDAYLATSKAEVAAFKGAVELVHHTYLIRKTNPVVVGDGSVAIDTTSGWPTGTGSGGAACVNLWESVLENSEPVTAVSSPTSTLNQGWNAFATSVTCSYGKKFGDRTFASGDLPHFVYYIQDVSPVVFNGQTYEGKAGEIQLLNM